MKDEIYKFNIFEFISENVTDDYIIYLRKDEILENRTEIVTL